MKAISKYFAMCAIALLGLANTSCMSDDMDGTPSCDYDVVLEYKVGGSATETRAAVTRAAVEDGSEDLNENKIERLDLFVFNAAGKLVKSLPLTDASVQGSPTTEYKHKKLESNQLKRSEITGNTLYLVANLENISGITTLDELKAATINKAATFNPKAKQTSFVMDAKMEETKQIVNGTIHIQFQLKRALAKIRLNVQDDKGKTVAPTEYACQLMHYAVDGAIIAEGTSTNNALNTEAAASSKVTAPAVTQDNKAVFYSYANSWIDKKKKPYEEEPIDVNKQTYILLKAKFNNKDYFYKVPVNKRLYESNDAAIIDWAKFEPLYRLDRNTIYDVTAKVDREGGSDPENPAELKVLPTVLPWENGAEYTFNDAISIKTNIEKNGENSNEIAFNNATFGPKISFTEMNTNGKSWVLQTDSPDYGFIYADKVNADGSYDLADVMTVITGNGTTTEVKPFYVVPRSVLDYTQRDNYTCHVYMVAYSPNMKVIINAPSDGSEGTATGTGTKTDMVFTQVK
ncbi:fimbrial protein [Segatella copri]|uniref:fimbrial protein n=1 Tax=Segatella copri TaxID=165179 RepID=UPI001C46DA35|nr:fimbrial protein [Segatella copri]MBW0023928.1 FimB/Mfa2 family fimbrial subunit [Segatella copri]